MVDQLDPIVAADILLTRLEEDSDVAYAEVGAVETERREAECGTQREHESDLVETAGVWCRVFADGSAGYDYTSTLTEEGLIKAAGRATRAGRFLAQNDPSRYDADAVHRDSHPGWGIDRRRSDEKGVIEDPVRRLREVQEPLVGQNVDQLQLRYKRLRTDISVLTSTGSAIRTGLDRGSITISVMPTTGARIRSHVGTTTGSGVFEEIEPTIDSLADTIDRFAGLRKEGSESWDRVSVVLEPIAAGQLIHFLSQYFEMDARYSGACPFDRGERIAPTSLSIHDVIPPNSWAATAYDAEAHPTSPVTLVKDGIVRSFIHNTETAFEENGFRAGNFVFPLGFENPPRIHARHLDVEAGDEPIEALRNEATLSIRRFTKPQLLNEATRAKRRSWMPPSALYARNSREHTPDHYDETEQSIKLGIAEGYLLQRGEPSAVISQKAVKFSPEDLENIQALSVRRDTVTGTCSKHKSLLPFAVTTPAIRLPVAIVDRRR